MLAFDRHTFDARILMPDGRETLRPVEIRTHPITGRTCRITYSRSQENEPGTATLPLPPPSAADQPSCPFCQANLGEQTPRLMPDLCPDGRMRRGRSTLFPNMFPYGRYSAVSLFDDRHFVEIGTARFRSYVDCFLNCRDYLCDVLRLDPAAIYQAITQNHLPSAGGSLVHPHLQVQAERIPSNHQRFLKTRAVEYRKQTGRRLFSDYLAAEQADGRRWIGATGAWHWLAAFAPEGFFEIWGLLPEVTALDVITDDQWHDLVRGVLAAQRYYRSLGRNGYNLGLLFQADGTDDLEVRVVLIVRGNYASWVRSDITGFEVMLGDMATFTAPEQTAAAARRFWPESLSPPPPGEPADWQNGS